MIKWEYKTVFNDTQVTDDSITNFLNAEGQEGWELVNVIYLLGTYQAIFKREIVVNTATMDTNLPWKTRDDFDDYYNRDNTKCGCTERDTCLYHNSEEYQKECLKRICGIGKDK